MDRIEDEMWLRTWQMMFSCSQSSINSHKLFKLRRRESGTSCESWMSELTIVDLRCSDPSSRKKEDRNVVKTLLILFWGEKRTHHTQNQSTIMCGYGLDGIWIYGYGFMGMDGYVNLSSSHPNLSLDIRYHPNV